MLSAELLAYSDSLKQLGIEHEIIEHPEYRDFRDTVKHLKISVADCIPTLIMRADDQVLAVVIRAGFKIDFKRLKRQLGIKNLRMANATEFAEATGVPPGAARVYTAGARTLIDPHVFESKYAYGGSGEFTTTVRYKTEDLARIVDSEIVECVEVPDG